MAAKLDYWTERTAINYDIEKYRSRIKSLKNTSDYIKTQICNNYNHYRDKLWHIRHVEIELAFAINDLELCNQKLLALEVLYGT